MYGTRNECLTIYTQRIQAMMKKKGKAKGMMKGGMMKKKGMKMGGPVIKKKGMAKGGMAKKKGYAKGGAVNKNSKRIAGPYS